MLEKTKNWIFDWLSNWSGYHISKFANWLDDRLWEWRYKDYTEEDWAEIYNEMEYDRLKDEGYFDDPFYKG